MRVAAAYLGALPVTETNCVTKPFQPGNCPNCHPTKICGLHSSEGIAAIVPVLKQNFPSEIAQNKPVGLQLLHH